MEQLIGHSISPGLAAGTIYLRPSTLRSVQPASTLSPRIELDRFHRACDQTVSQLRELEGKALAQAGRESANILHVHAMLLEDPDFLETAEELIAAGSCAEHAVIKTGERFSAAFSLMESATLRARAADVEEVSCRVADLLSGTAAAPLPPSPVLLAADTLAPGELLHWGPEHLLGLILRHGSPYDHTAILARAMGIPALSGTVIPADWQGRPAILDGSAGQLILDPEPAEFFQIAQARQTQAPEGGLCALPAVTLDGRKIPLLANIGSSEEAAQALALGAEGVGLFRSEFLFLDQTSLPDEEVQYQSYRQAAQAMAGRPMVIRTLDVGADKPLAGLFLPSEENPALGCRGIRLSLAQPALFCTQLRAILRAAVCGNVSVMFPMVTCLEEVRQAKALLALCQQELAAAGTLTGSPQVGVMIETPAAALLADELAQEVSFFSIGTNDLTQYTLAADRQCAAPGLYNPRHPAVLALIQMAAAGAHRHGCRVALCGELGSEPDMTAQLLRLGVDELSVSPAALSPLRQQIRTLDLTLLT